MAFAVFGPGSLYVRRTDIAGSTPVNIGFAQEFSLDESAENKELFGQKQYPLVVARGTIKVTGKVKAAEISAIALNNAYYGEAAFASGQTLVAQGEEETPPAVATENSSSDTPSGAVITVVDTTGIFVGMRVTGHANIPTGAYVLSFIANTSITLNTPVTGDVPTATPMTFHPGKLVTNAADFVADLGVLFSSTGLPLAKATSPLALTTGQYYADEVNGVYFFADADGGTAFLFTYAYSSVSGQTLTVTNKNIGNTPTFEIWYTTILNAKPYTLHVFQAVASKLNQQFKLTDFMMPEIDFAIFANPAGKVYEASYPDVS
jgi:hypothetical protein